MLGLSHTTTYAIKALACLDHPNCANRHIRDIALCTGIPRSYLAKVFNALSRRGLIKAKRGYKGGISLARPASQITLLQIIEAIEGPDWISPCLLAGEKCPPGFRCPTKAFWDKFKRDLVRLLEKTTLERIIAVRRAMEATGELKHYPVFLQAKRRPGRPGLRRLL